MHSKGGGGWDWGPNILYQLNFTITSTYTGSCFWESAHNFRQLSKPHLMHTKQYRWKGQVPMQWNIITLTVWPQVSSAFLLRRRIFLIPLWVRTKLSGVRPFPLARGVGWENPAFSIWSSQPQNFFLSISPKLKNLQIRKDLHWSQISASLNYSWFSGPKL